MAPAAQSACSPASAPELKLSVSTMAKESSTRHEYLIGVGDVDASPVNGCESQCGALDSGDGCVDLCARQPGYPETSERLAFLPQHSGRLLPSSASESRQRADAARLQQLIDMNQHGHASSPCEWSQVLMPLLHFDGIMGMVHQMASWLIWGAMHNRVYRPSDQEDAFARHAYGLSPEVRRLAGPGCERGMSFECFFANVVPANCRCSPHRSHGVDGNYTAAMRRALPPLNMGWGRGDDPNEVNYGSNATFKRHGGFWVHAQAVAYIFRPLHSKLLAQRRANELAALGWGQADRPREPVIGMHIRYGDKCKAQVTKKTEGRARGLCDPLFRAYRRAAETLRAQYGVRRIFLATDSLAALDACRSWTGFTCDAFRHSRRGINSVRNAKENPSSGNVTMEIILDVDTLAWCDFFIGSFYYSQVSNIAYELLVARAGRHVPFINFGHWAWGDIDHGSSVFKTAIVGRTSVSLDTQLSLELQMSHQLYRCERPWWWRLFMRSSPTADECVAGYWRKMCSMQGAAIERLSGISSTRACAGIAQATQASTFMIHHGERRCHTYHAPSSCYGRMPPTGWVTYSTLPQPSA